LKSLISGLLLLGLFASTRAEAQTTRTEQGFIAGGSLDTCADSRAMTLMTLLA
jgi:hypothetical protein